MSLLGSLSHVCHHSGHCLMYVTTRVIVSCMSPLVSLSHVCHHSCHCFMHAITGIVILCVRYGGSAAKAPDSQSREPGFQSTVSKLGAISVIPRFLSSSSCINEFLSIDTGGFIRNNNIRVGWCCTFSVAEVELVVD